MIIENTIEKWSGGWSDLTPEQVEVMEQETQNAFFFSRLSSFMGALISFFLWGCGVFGVVFGGLLSLPIIAYLYAKLVMKKYVDDYRLENKKEG